MHFRDFTLNDTRYERVSKHTARRFFMRGRQVYCLACNLNPLTPFVSMCDMRVFSNGDFDTIVNGYEWYNCNNECGRYAAFYVPQLIIPTWYKTNTATIDGARYRLFWLSDKPSDDDIATWENMHGCIMLKSHPQYAPELKADILAVPLDGYVRAYYA